MKKKYITTPLYYVNSSPHIGHSYTQIACDAVVRHLKQRGMDVFFMTGTDEHGEKIEKASVEKGFGQGREKDFVDSIVPRFKELWKKLNIEYDYFIRTTDKAHKRTVRKILGQLYDKKDIYKKVYNGWFCTPCEMFWSEVQVEKGVCPDCGRPLEKLDEENYFFSISKYQGRLIEAIEKNKLEVRPEMRKNEVLGFLRTNTLQDLCISRPKNRLKWGIELPFDNAYVIYVWIDALINYISGIGYAEQDHSRFLERWPCDMHVIGKDILRHHAIYWPILLFALDVGLPKRVFAHGWWIMGGEKMSKSKGNVVDPLYLLDEKKYPVDAFRYFLLSQVRFGWDGHFSEKLFIEKYNSDLANDLGNLLNRTLTMVEKYFGGTTPEVKKGGESLYKKHLGKEAFDLGKLLESMSRALPGKVISHMDIDDSGPDFQAVLFDIWALVKHANKYIEVSAPWKQSKENNIEALSLIMDNLVQGMGVAACLLYPFMPYTAKRMWDQLGLGNMDMGSLKIDELKWGIVPYGTKTKKDKPLFPRLK